MIREANILNPTGAMYMQESPHNALSTAFVSAVNVHNPAFSYARTGGDTGFLSYEQQKISPSLLPYYYLSMTTGSELRDIDIIVVIEEISEHITTSYHVAFQCYGWSRASSSPPLQSTRLKVPSDARSASTQAERLREISGLTIERLAKMLGVSRTTYHKWLSGLSLHDMHREHLLEVLSLMEEAAQRFGSPGSVSTWLLTPVSPGGKKPVDYLTERQYTLFRGFLLRVRTGQEMFRPLAHSHRVYKERSPEDVKAILRRLRPRIWKDDEDLGLSDTDDGDIKP